MTDERDKDLTGATPASGQQHGDSSGEGGSVDRQREDQESGLHHPRPNTPGSKVEDQADQPGVNPGT